MGEQEVGNLQYISEGNVHIVLELSGTEKVLRLIKEDEKPTPFLDVQISSKFVNVVMAPLLQEKANNTQEIIELSAERISQLSKCLQDIRPVHRRFKSKLSPFAIKTKNLTLLSPKCHSNYCIEIKPKEGFIAPAFRSLHKCYYCLKQHLKLDSKQIQEKSDYCPLDLFSCERSRIKRALLSLVCNPQNNFKIFKNGKVIFDEQYNKQDFENVIKCMGVFNSVNIYFDFIIDILMSSNNNQNIILKETPVPEILERNQTCVENNHMICQFEEKEVPFICKLLQSQKLSQSVDIDLSDIGHGKEYVQDLLGMLQKEKLDLHLKDDRDIFFEKANPLHLGMISAVAKDCSIMIAYSPEYIENYPFITTDNKKIPYTISLTDLEPKNLESLVRRRRTENKMIEAFNNYQEKVTEGICLIQPHIETRTKQLEAWQQLITDYFKANKLSTLDVREAQNLPLFNNAAINRKLSQESLLIVLEDMSRSGRAAPLDKSKSVWEVYWHSLDEWGNMVYSWASSNGLSNAVCTLFELREGDNTVHEEFHGLDMNILTKALKTLEAKGKCELIEFDDNQGVKFF